MERGDVDASHAMPVAYATIFEGEPDPSMPVIYARMNESMQYEIVSPSGPECDGAAPISPLLNPASAGNRARRFSPVPTESDNDDGDGAPTGKEPEGSSYLIPFDEIAAGTAVYCTLIDGEQFLAAKDVTASLMHRLLGKPSSASYVTKKWDKIYEDARDRLGIIKPVRIPGFYA